MNEDYFGTHFMVGTYFVHENDMSVENLKLGTTWKTMMLLMLYTKSRNDDDDHWDSLLFVYYYL